MKGTRSFQVFGGEPHAIAKTSPDRGGLIESDPAESEFAELLGPVGGGKRCEHCDGAHYGADCPITYPTPGRSITAPNGSHDGASSAKC